ncbi:MAG: S9 family peptidase [Acidobacteria bacterium]|nr:S9 family peptidase [Acidobacteriota bacterium]
MSLPRAITLPAELPPLIPRENLFGNPDRTRPEVSPDGESLAYLAPHEGVLNVWVRSIGGDHDRPVTRERRRGIQWYAWARNSGQILYVQDKEGDENWHIYSLDLETLQERDLTPRQNIQARFVAVEHDFPDDVLVSLNDRDPRFHDIYQLDLRSGALNLRAENSEGFMSWQADHQLRLRAAVKADPDGTVVLMVRDEEAAPWRTLLRWEFEDSITSRPLGFTPDNRGLFIVSSEGSDTSQLREVDLSSGRQKLLAQDEGADVDEVVLHPIRHTVQAVGFDGGRLRWQVLDSSIAEDFAYLQKVQRGDFHITSRDRDDRVWIVCFKVDDGPARYYAYRRDTPSAELLFSTREVLESATLARMEPVSIRARDGLMMTGYLTTPAGIEARDLPMVLRVHGGPWARDSWGCHEEVQWLANRGYAVLQVNYRGSIGFGKTFTNAGDREWGGKMQEDLLDAVDWAVEKGVADPRRVAVLGGSYGGYAVLAGLAFTPDRFACGVDIVGPSSLLTLLETMPPYWKPWESVFFKRVGHPERDEEFLRSRSPLFKADCIDRPLLIAQGANDPRVKRAESLQIVEALRKRGKIVEYVEYADEGHGFVRPENRLDFYMKAEKFLATHIGGRYQE